jgi:surfeit locus 1 family protein
MASRELSGSERVAAPLFAGVKPVSLAGVTICLAILLSLGVWQVKRLAWKEGVLARIAALQIAPPEPLDVVLNRLGGRGEVDFVRVQTSCATLQQTPTIRLYSILDGVMGYRLITACPIQIGAYRSLLVDRGFVPSEGVGQVQAGAEAPGGPVDGLVVGVLRRPERANWMTPVNTPAAPGQVRVWRSRDLPAMAAALNAPDPAPVFLMLERPAAPRPGPQPAAIPTNIPNNHLGYALTWFGLAAGLAAMYVASLLRARRN